MPANAPASHSRPKTLLPYRDSDGIPLTWRRWIPESQPQPRLIFAISLLLCTLLPPEFQRECHGSKSGLAGVHAGFLLICIREGLAGDVCIKGDLWRR